jgi:hypothetical protein
MNQTPASEEPDVRAIAREYSRDLEAMQHQIDFVEGLTCDVLEVVADTRGEVILVLATGGPHVELHLGDGAPRIHVYWGGDQASCVVDWSTQTLNELDLGAWWHAAMKRSLADPPYEDWD